MAKRAGSKRKFIQSNNVLPYPVDSDMETKAFYNSLRNNAGKGIVVKNTQGIDVPVRINGSSLERQVNGKWLKLDGETKTETAAVTPQTSSISKSAQSNDSGFVFPVNGSNDNSSQISGGGNSSINSSNQNFNDLLGRPMGIATLDENTKLAQVQIPNNLPKLDENDKLDLDNIPDSVALLDENDLIPDVNISDNIARAFTGVTDTYQITDTISLVIENGIITEVIEE